MDSLLHQMISLVFVIKKVYINIVVYKNLVLHVPGFT
jgi:hypothetical protein